MPVIFTVECEEHGIMEITPEQNSECPRICFIPTKNGRCGKPLKRIYDIPNVHFKGSGFTKTSA